MMTFNGKERHNLLVLDILSDKIVGADCVAIQKANVTIGIMNDAREENELSRQGV